MANPMGFQPVPMMVIGGIGVIPPHIQLQQAQEAFLLHQQQQQILDLELEPDRRPGVAEEDSNSANVPEDNRNDDPQDDNPQFQLEQAAGDANNNDQPEDANNNTTDPALQQLQQQQLRLQQQHQQNIVNQVIISHDPNPVIENGTKGKKEKRKKKKKKKNRLVTVIAADGSFRKELPNEGVVNGTRRKVDVVIGADVDENDEPEEKVEVE